MVMKEIFLLVKRSFSWHTATAALQLHSKSGTPAFQKSDQNTPQNVYPAYFIQAKAKLYLCFIHPSI